MSKKSHAFVPVILALAVAPAALAAGTPCAPCGGLSVADPYALIPALSAAPKIDPEARLYIAWDVDLDAAVTPAAGHALATAGATPWLRLVFRAAPPLFDHLDALQVELDTAAALAASLIPRAHFEVVWRPPGDPATAPSAQEYAFLIKRAAVALTGADPDAKVIAGPLPEDPAWLEEFYGQDVAAYVDALAFPPADEATERALVESATTLDPGKTLVLEGVALPDPRPRLLAEAARAQARGFGVTLFAAAGPLTAADVAPLALLADEFRGELSLDPGTRPTGAREAWSFVRGEDLALRVIVDNPDGSDSVSLSFPDPQLRDPERVLPDGEVVPLSGYRRTPSALQVEVADPGPAAILRVQRASIQELEGVAEEVTVNSRRQMPVEEILRRLQSFEDAQNRRVRHWRAVNSTTLRFQLASGVQTIEATFEGEIFYRPGEPFDWVWQNFYLNGVKWRGKSIPEIPLVQPEKAAAMPLEILFSKAYRYSLAGTDTVAGRDCWVVDFEPNAAVQAGTTLYRGRVWIDRATYARVRTRAVQLGLQGEVLSNEETLDYTPVDAEGRPTDWGAGAFVLPLHTTGQQVLSVVNTATVVEKDVRITGVVVNGPDFDEQHERALASEATMVRDTQGGLRYLVKEGAAPGGRVVQEGFDTSKLFALAGIFYDDSLSYPLPLAGVNYFNLDFHGNKRQLNAFFGGVLGIVNYADPRFLGSKVDLGADFFAIAIASSDQVFRDGNEVQAEEVKELPARARLNFGFPLGNFVKVSSSYELSYSHYSRADHTADDFVLPENHFTHHLGLGVQYARAGYRLNLEGAWHSRSKWDFWGPPGNTEFDAATKTYTTWEVTASKNFYLTKFRKIGIELDAFGGSDLDRFSKYQFGFFGSNRVHGYQIGKVKAEKGYAAHLTYGFEIGNLLRLDAVGDAAWATDRSAGLERELLAGAGLQGSFMGPWETLVQVDVGTPVAGPDTGIVAYVVFLKLFK